MPRQPWNSWLQRPASRPTTPRGSSRCRHALVSRPTGTMRSLVSRLPGPSLQSRQQRWPLSRAARWSGSRQHTWFRIQRANWPTNLSTTATSQCCRRLSIHESCLCKIFRPRPSSSRRLPLVWALQLPQRGPDTHMEVTSPRLPSRRTHRLDPGCGTRFTWPWWASARIWTTRMCTSPCQSLLQRPNLPITS